MYQQKKPLAMSSFLKVMLGENYAKGYIRDVKTDVGIRATYYRIHYTQCSTMLEKLVDRSNRTT